MSQAIEIKVPDIGDYQDVPVIEVLVAPGDTVEKEQSLITLESDKATMDVPSSASGKVKEVRVKQGDTVSMGSVIVTLEAAEQAASAQAGASGKALAAAAPPAVTSTPAASAPAAQNAPAAQPAGGSAPAGSSAPREVKVPDIGDYTDVPVIEVHVKAGDTVEKEQSLLTLESDKATMDVPSPDAGKVKSVSVKVGDTVSKGSVILVLEGADAQPAAGGAAQAPAQATQAPPSAPAPRAAAAPAQAGGAQGGSVLAEAPAIRAPAPGSRGISHASPSVRKFARELGVDVSLVQGSGPKGRITEDDVRAFVKQAMTSKAVPAAASAAPAQGGGELNLLPWPKVDFAKFGPIDPKPMSRIKKISGANLHRNWVMIPHVTQCDDADITELEAMRVQLNKENEKAGVKMTMLAFLIKACVAALKKFPAFNASLDGDTLVYKNYYHIGFAADTPNGLVVPVLRDADRKGLLEIAGEMAVLSKLARDGKLKSDQMQGGSFSISSLGGIGGTYFTPLINAPEVAIMGVCRSTMRPVWNGKEFAPRLILPMSLSYDHRVIDGAEAARFNTYLTQVLADFRRVML